MMDGTQFLAFARSVASGVYDDDLVEIQRVCRERQTELARQARDARAGAQGRLLGLPEPAPLPPGGD